MKLFPKNNSSSLKSQLLKVVALIVFRSRSLPRPTPPSEVITSLLETTPPPISGQILQGVFSLPVIAVGVPHPPPLFVFLPLHTPFLVHLVFETFFLDLSGQGFPLASLPPEPPSRTPSRILPPIVPEVMNLVPFLLTLSSSRLNLCFFFARSSALRRVSPNLMRPCHSCACLPSARRYINHAVILLPFFFEAPVFGIARVTTLPS